jgi:NADH dehydrogenase/NADH:ubiquinone oxidoreductase subunit G
VESIDVLDGLGSSIRLDSKGSDLMRVLPRSNDLINQQ